MTIDQALRALILSDDSVTALIGDRVEPGTNTIDVSKGLPKAVYTCIGEDDEYCDDGRVGITRAIYQLDIFATHKSDADVILKTITNLIEAEDNFPHVNDDITIDWITRRNRRHNQTETTPGANTGPKRVTREFSVIYREP